MKERLNHKLRSLIGRRVKWQSQEHIIIEILEDEMALVLKSMQMPGVIQSDQHGEAHRRVPDTVMIPVYSSAAKTEFNSDFLDLQLDL